MKPGMRRQRLIKCHIPIAANSPTAHQSSIIVLAGTSVYAMLPALGPCGQLLGAASQLLLPDLVWLVTDKFSLRVIEYHIRRFYILLILFYFISLQLQTGNMRSLLYPTKKIKQTRGLPDLAL